MSKPYQISNRNGSYIVSPSGGREFTFDTAAQLNSWLRERTLLDDATVSKMIAEVDALGYQIFEFPN